MAEEKSSKNVDKYNSPSQPALPVGYLSAAAHTEQVSSALHLEHVASLQADKNKSGSNVNWL